MSIFQSLYSVARRLRIAGKLPAWHVFYLKSFIQLLYDATWTSITTIGKSKTPTLGSRNVLHLASRFSHSLPSRSTLLRKIMPADECVERPLFGDAISSCFPRRFEDVSNIREVPDHQEVFADPSRDESLIFELLDFKHEVEDDGSAIWFLRDLASEQGAEESMVLEHSSTPEAVGLQYRDVPVIVTTAIGQMAISKGRQGREAQNIVRVYLANLRLKEVGTDMLVTAYEPILINPLSESARVVGAGLAIPAAQSGCLPMAEVFKLAVASFKINNWNLFGGGN